MVRSRPSDFPPPGPESAAGGVGRTIPASIAIEATSVSVASETAPVFAGVADPVTQPPMAQTAAPAFVSLPQCFPEVMRQILAQMMSMVDGVPLYVAESRLRERHEGCSLPVSQHQFRVFFLLSLLYQLGLRPLQQFRLYLPQP